MKMVKKITIVLFSLGVVATGVLGFRKLNYWERSAWIFRYSNTDQRFEGRGGRPVREFRERPEGEFGDRREGARETFEGRGERGTMEFSERTERAFRDTTRRVFRDSTGRAFRDTTGRIFRDTTGRVFRDSIQREFRQRSDDRASFGPGDRGRGGRGRGDFRGGQKVRLRNVWWFLAVFSAFTALAVYLDQGWLRIRKKRKRSTG